MKRCALDYVDFVAATAAVRDGSLGLVCSIEIVVTVDY